MVINKVKFHSRYFSFYSKVAKHGYIFSFSYISTFHFFRSREMNHSPDSVVLVECTRWRLWPDVHMTAHTTGPPMTTTAAVMWWSLPEWDLRYALTNRVHIIKSLLQRTKYVNQTNKYKNKQKKNDNEMQNTAKCRYTLVIRDRCA